MKISQPCLPVSYHPWNADNCNKDTLIRNMCLFNAVFKRSNLDPAYDQGKISKENKRHKQLLMFKVCAVGHVYENMWQ